MTFPITTTLRRILAANPCRDGRERALTAAGKTEPDDEPIQFAAIVEAVGLHDALWCCRAEPQHSRIWRLYAVWCARRVQHLTSDPHSLVALDVASRHANGLASDEELAAAQAAAQAAARGTARGTAQAAARGTARGTARAAARGTARDTALAAAGAAAWAADALAAAGAAAWAADAAADAAVDAVCAAFSDAWASVWASAAYIERTAQREAFLQLVTTGTLPPVKEETCE